MWGITWIFYSNLKIFKKKWIDCTYSQVHNKRVGWKKTSRETYRKKQTKRQKKISNNPTLLTLFPPYSFIWDLKKCQYQNLSATSWRIWPNCVVAWLQINMFLYMMNAGFFLSFWLQKIYSIRGGRENSYFAFFRL